MMTREELEKMVIEYMDSYTTVTLAGSMDQRPWAAAVFYARRGFDLIFFSSPTSRHSEIFEQNPRAAAAIHGDYREWRDIRGLQMEGKVAKITGIADKAACLATYLMRYPFVKQFFSDPSGIGAEVLSKTANVALYIFRPESIRYLSNEVGFGKKWKFEIRDGNAVGEVIEE